MGKQDDIFIEGNLKEGDSIMPEEELPIIASEFSIKSKNSSLSKFLIILIKFNKKLNKYSLILKFIIYY